MNKIIKNKKLYKLKFLGKILLLYSFLVGFLYFSLGWIKLNKTPDSDMGGFKTLIVFIIIVIILLFFNIVLVYTTLKNKGEAKLISSLLNTIILPSTVLGAILIGVENLESIASFQAFIQDSEPIEAYADLFKATYLVIAPLVLSIFYNAVIWWRKLPEFKE